MESSAPCIYINDDEIELKQVVIMHGNLKKVRKFTISEAEKRGLVRVESSPTGLCGERYSKSIFILHKGVRLCLSTKV